MADNPQRAEHEAGFLAELHTLRLIRPFRIAHGSSATRQLLRVSWSGAVGEAPFVPYYRDTPEASLAWFQHWKPDSQWQPTSTADAPRQARLALDLLRHDLEAKQQNAPLWRHLKLSNPSGRAACRSLGIPEDLDAHRDEVRRLSKHFTVLKLKLGGGNVDFDEAIAAKAREAAPYTLLFADANGGWTASEAAALIPKLARHGVAFIEQPVHHTEGVEPWRELRSRLASASMPLFADESVQQTGDLAALSGLIQGVNIKLLKCGSLSGALELLARARADGLRTILGCMIESSIGTTAAAHLAAQMDYIDLDGHLYLADDDYAGLEFDSNGRLLLPECAGIGAVPKETPPRPHVS